MDTKSAKGKYAIVRPEDGGEIWLSSFAQMWSHLALSGNSHNIKEVEPKHHCNLLFLY